MRTFGDRYRYLYLFAVNFSTPIQMGLELPVRRFVVFPGDYNKFYKFRQ
jgi:hypothetical protein